MIQPDRLKELIKQGATIYNKNKGSIKLDKSCYIDNSNVLCFYKIGIGYLGFDFIRNLFETEEEAKWYLEFGNITREEKLSLPSWEELQKDLDKRIGDFWIEDNFYFVFIYDKRDFNSQIILRTKDENFNWTATKENYIDACRLCKKLFLGETI